MSKIKSEKATQLFPIIVVNNDDGHARKPTHRSRRRARVGGLVMWQRRPPGSSSLFWVCDGAEKKIGWPLGCPRAVTWPGRGRHGRLGCPCCSVFVTWWIEGCSGGQGRPPCRSSNCDVAWRGHLASLCSV
jgi:hypothetical protein